jgi:photosystem II stability/assembly factor-like uncharacterized protein
LAEPVIKIKFGTGAAYALSTRKGLHKSTDEGATWTQVTDSLTQDSLTPSNLDISSATAFYDLALDQKQDGVIYLGTEQGLYRTVNEGANWSFLSLPVKNSGLRVSATAVSPGDSNVLYASVVSTIYKSTNGGLTWETKVLPTQAVIRSIIINPASNNIIYLGLRS